MNDSDGSGEGHHCPNKKTKKKKHERKEKRHREGEDGGDDKQQEEEVLSLSRNSLPGESIIPLNNN